MTVNPSDPSNSGCRPRPVLIFFPVKRKDNREHFVFENVHVLNFASRVVFGEMFTGKKKFMGEIFQNVHVHLKILMCTFRGELDIFSVFTGRTKFHLELFEALTLFFQGNSAEA